VTPDDDDDFVAGTLAALRAESAAAQDERLVDTLRAAPRPPSAPPAPGLRAGPRSPRRPVLRYALTALAAGLLAAVGTYLLTRPAEAPRDDAFALDGARGPGAATTMLPWIRTDTQGRPAEIARRVDGRLDGERVLFRAGQVMRIEHYRAGQLHGPALDFDGLGRLVALRTYEAGVERGPYLELSPDGAVRASGSR